MTMRSLAWTALLLGALTLAACGGTEEEPAPPATTLTVGSAGGTLDGPAGAQIVVPPGALAAPVAIVLAQSASGAPPLATGTTVLGPTFAATPHGTTFAVPVTIRIPFDPSLLETGFQPSLLKTTAGQAGWAPVAGATVSGNALVAQISSFSLLVPAYLPQPPGIYFQPQNQAAVAPAPATFTVGARGPTRSGVLTYQWKRNGTAISGANGPTYALAATSFGDDGALFTVDVSNAIGTVSSAPAMLRVSAALVAPTIDVGPAGKSINVGESATFTVSVTAQAPSYRWEIKRVGDAAFGDTGVTTPSYTLANATLADSGAQIRVVVSNAAGSATSAAATLNVAPALVAPVIDATKGPTNQSIVVGGSAAFSVTASGQQLTYRWQIKRTGAAAFGDAGVTTPTYTLTNATLADNGALIRVIVSNPAGSVTSSPEALLTVTVAMPTGGTPGARLAAGDRLSVVQVSDGTLRSWGSDFSGALGEGPTRNANRSTPGAVAGLTNVVAIDSAAATTLAVRANGEVWGFGFNGFGQLCNGTTADAEVPVRFVGTPKLSSVLAVAVGNSHTLVLRGDGGIEACGYNATGALGNPSVPYLTMTAVEVIFPANTKKMKAIAAGRDFSLSLDEDGNVWAWGLNNNGQLAVPATLASTSTPQKVAGIGPVLLIAAGFDHVLAVTASDEIWSWGSNESGKLGRGNGSGVGASTSIPGRVDLTGKIVAISAGEHHSISAHFDGTVFTWGSNAQGQLGTGSLLPASTEKPVFIGAVSGARAVAAGLGAQPHSLVVDGTGAVWSWGGNSNGELGDGTTTARPTPAKIANLNLN